MNSCSPFGLGALYSKRDNFAPKRDKRAPQSSGTLKIIAPEKAALVVFEGVVLAASGRELHSFKEPLSRPTLTQKRRKFKPCLIWMLASTAIITSNGARLPTLQTGSFRCAGVV